MEEYKVIFEGNYVVNIMSGNALSAIIKAQKDFPSDRVIRCEKYVPYEWDCTWTTEKRRSYLGLQVVFIKYKKNLGVDYGLVNKYKCILAHIDCFRMVK